MILIDYVNGFYEAKFELPRSNFNEEILIKICGITFKQKSTVISIYQTKNYDEIHSRVKKFLDVKQLLKL